MKDRAPHVLCVAPMMDRTDRHDRYFLRLIARRAMLYTEMITTGAILHGDAHRLLRFDPREHPVALQLGGCEPAALAACARRGAEYGYDEINLNVGCPSGRATDARFGACLMAEPDLVARCVAAMRDACARPVTVKTRIGIDGSDGFAFLDRFVSTVAAAGCGTFIVHARAARLDGWSPRQNREIPPLRHDLVHRLKRARPRLEIVLNGGIATVEDAATHIGRVDGVMIGRAAYEDPYLLARIERRLFAASDPAPTRRAIIESYIPYVERQLEEHVPLHRMTRHMLGLFRGRPGARAWRRRLSEDARRPGAGAELLRDAAARMPGETVPA